MKESAARIKSIPEVTGLKCMVAFCLLAVALTISCVKLPRRIQLIESEVPGGRAAISINEASPAEMEKLPGIGPGLAARIVEHRQRHGRFRRVEHLLMVRGINERRFQQLRPYITH